MGQLFSFWFSSMSKWVILIAWAVVCLLFPDVPVQCLAAEGAVPGHGNGIVIVDINSELLFALGEYHELTREEKRQATDIQERIIPVIERIINGLSLELENCQALAARAGKHFGPVWKDKVNRHIKNFETELMVRQKALEFELLRRKQRHMLLESGD